MHWDAIDLDTASDPDIWARYITCLRDIGRFDVAELDW